MSGGGTESARAVSTQRHCGSVQVPVQSCPASVGAVLTAPSGGRPTWSPPPPALTPLPTHAERTSYFKGLASLCPAWRQVTESNSGMSHRSSQPRTPQPPDPNRHVRPQPLDAFPGVCRSHCHTSVPFLSPLGRCRCHQVAEAAVKREASAY